MAGTQACGMGAARCGSVRRRTRMPTATSTKANSVPMLVSCTISSMLANPAKTPTKTPVRIVVMCGVLYFGWTLAAQDGKQAVAGHREEDARLTHLEDDQDGCRGEDRSERDDAGGPVHAQRREGRGQRFGSAELRPRQHAR